MKDSSNQPKSAKKGRDRIPPPQRLRIMQKYVAGESFVQIGREEHRDRDTVARIVKSEEMQEFIRQMREQFYGLAGDAIEAVRYALQNERDGRLGFQLLATMGVIPSEAERSALAPTESAEDAEQAAVATEVEKLSFLTINMAKTFKQPLPHVAEVEPTYEEPQHDSADTIEQTHCDARFLGKYPIDAAGWIENTKGMIGLDADTYLTGHGDMMTKADVQKKLDLIQDKYNKIKAMVAQGKSLDDGVSRQVSISSQISETVSRIF